MEGNSNSAIQTENNQNKIESTTNDFEKINDFLNDIDSNIPNIKDNFKKISSNINNAELITVIDNLHNIYNPICDKITDFYNDQVLKRKIDNDSATYLNLLHKLKNNIVTPVVFFELIKEDLTDSGKLPIDYLKTLATIDLSILSWESLSMSIRNLENSELILENIGIRNIFDSSVEELKSSIVDKKIKINSDINSDITVMADFEQLKSIIYDVVNNAIKFTNKGGNIDIATKSSGNVVEITVKDDGIGISTELQERLLKEYVNPGIGTNGEQGSGTGLQIASIIMNKMNGSIKIESEGEGKGTKVILTLPKAE